MTGGDRPSGGASPQPPWWKPPVGEPQRPVAGREAPRWWEAPAAAERREGTPPSSGDGRRATARSATTQPLIADLAAASCVVAPLLVALDGPVWARFAAVLAFLSLAPGAAILHRLQAPGARLETGFVVCVSLAVTVVGAQCMLWLGAWHPRALTYLLAVGCLVALTAPRSPSAFGRGAETAPARLP
jgi:hypothetical protein